MSARIRSSTASVPRLWNTRNQAQLLVDERADAVQWWNDCGDSGAHFWLSSTIEAARNRLELALGRKQPSPTTKRLGLNHLGLKK
jgi:hypothetical protein